MVEHSEVERMSLPLRTSSETPATSILSCGGVRRCRAVGGSTVLRTDARIGRQGREKLLKYPRNKCIVMALALLERPRRAT